ncbi:MAG: hypothetical protein QM811_18055 [Pirellulales bacterium]
MFRWPDPSSRRLRGLAASAVLLAYVLLATGVALPLPVSARIANGKDRSTPFPCMDKACGCMNAAQCFQGCCCSTREERVAWFAEHAIDTTAWATATDANSTTICEDAPDVACAAHGSCCERPATKSCCETSGVARAKVESCCAKEQVTVGTSCCGQPSTPAKSPAAQWDSAGVCGVEPHVMKTVRPPANAACCAARETTKKSCCDPSAKTAENDHEPAVKWTGVSLSALMRCRGAAKTFLDVPVSIPCSLDLPQLAPIAVVGTVAQLDPLYDAPAFLPDGPPPRG